MNKINIEIPSYKGLYKATTYREIKPLYKLLLQLSELSLDSNLINGEISKIQRGLYYRNGNSVFWDYLDSPHKNLINNPHTDILNNSEYIKCIKITLHNKGKEQSFIISTEEKTQGFSNVIFLSDLKRRMEEDEFFQKEYGKSKFDAFREYFFTINEHEIRHFSSDEYKEKQKEIVEFHSKELLSCLQKHTPKQ